MDLPFLDPTPSGTASNPMPWETPNQESSDDATLNELLALYQTGSDSSPFDTQSTPPFALDPPPSFGQDSPFPPFAGPETGAAASDSPFPPFAAFEDAPSAPAQDSPFASLPGAGPDEFGAPLMDPFASLLDGPDSSSQGSPDTSGASDAVDAILRDFAAAAPVVEAASFSPLSDLPPVADPFAKIFADEPPQAPVAAVPEPAPFFAPVADPFAKIFDDEPPQAPVAEEPEPTPLFAPVADPFAKIFDDEPPQAPVAADPEPEPLPTPVTDPFANIFADEPPQAPVTVTPAPAVPPAIVAASPSPVLDEKRPTVSAAPPLAPVPAVFVATDVLLETADARTGAMQAAIAELQGLASGYDAARDKIDDLYAQLARAASDKENVERLSSLLGLLQAARGELGPNSELARRAEHVKQTAQAFFDLISRA